MARQIVNIEKLAEAQEAADAAMEAAQIAAEKVAEAMAVVSPDAKPARWHRGNKTQITFTIAPALVDKLDAAADRHHVSRSALMTMWLGERLEKEPPA